MLEIVFNFVHGDDFDQAMPHVGPTTDWEVFSQDEDKRIYGQYDGYVISFHEFMFSLIGYRFPFNEFEESIINPLFIEPS